MKVSYVTCPIEKRLLLLFTFLKKNRNKKVVVVFNSTASAKYHNELFRHLDLDTTHVNINDKPSKINDVFTRTTHFILLCRYDLMTLHKKMPIFDWCILYEPVNVLGDFTSQIDDKLLLILHPFETGILDRLKESFDVDEFKFPSNKIIYVQLQIEKLIAENYVLNTMAKEAFKYYLREYDGLKRKDIFDVKNIELKKLCLAFGFKVPVAVDLMGINNSVETVSERRIKRKGSDGYGYYDDSEGRSERSEYRRVEDAKKLKIYKPVKKRKNVHFKR